jgi:hypothetical protein
MLHITGFDYKLVTRHAIETARQLIELYDLHRNPDHATDILPMLAGFDMRFLELPDTTWGFTLEVGPKIVIAINQTLTTPQTRYVAMHEVGHLACDHPNSLHASEEGQWLTDQLETEATTVAAFLLIPHEAVADPTRYRNITELARRYLVPPELAAIRRVLYQRTGL